MSHVSPSSSPVVQLPAPQSSFRLPPDAALPFIDFAWLCATASPALVRASPETLEQLFRVILEHTTEAVAILDEQARVLYANTSFVNATGLSGIELFGQSVRAIGLAPRRARTYREMVRALATACEWRGEYDCASPASEPRRVTVSVTRVESGGAGGKFVVMARDVTHQRRLEYIAEATNLVENVGYVFASLRHELGNPVNSVKTALTLLRQCLWTMPHDRVEGYLDRVLLEVGRIEYLLRSLQSFDTSRRPTLESVPMARFFERFARMIRPDVEHRGVALVIRVHESVGSAVADPRALHQVMLNLVTNALDAVAGRSGAQIEIAAHRGSHVRITVSDNGPGIPAERRRHVFRPFHTTKPKGTGLGLAITRKLVTFMRGTVELECGHGGGAVFTVTLDADEAPERRPASTCPPPYRAAE